MLGFGATGEGEGRSGGNPRRRGAGGLRVVAVPAYRNRATNPYNALLYAAVGRTGVRVEEVSPWRLLRAGYDVLHVHWPEYLFDAPRFGLALLRGLLFVAAIRWARWTGAKIVWTVHNVRAHEPWHARWGERMWRWFARRTDGYIALTPGGRRAALERFPTLDGRPGFVIPHGDYREAYPNEVSRAAARAALGLPAAARVVCFFGAVRPYKNVPALVAAFRGVPGADWRLVVAGKPATPELGAEVAARATGDGRVRLDLGFVPNERVQLFLRAADLLVFPYREIQNSGSALLALSFDRPVLVPERGAMAELREAVGAEWVRTYGGELDAAALMAAMAWAEATPRDGARLRRALDWEAIARETVRAYEAVVVVPGRRVRRRSAPRRSRHGRARGGGGRRGAVVTGSRARAGWGRSGVSTQSDGTTPARGERTASGAGGIGGGSLIRPMREGGGWSRTGRVLRNASGRRRRCGRAESGSWPRSTGRGGGGGRGRAGGWSAANPFGDVAVARLEDDLARVRWFAACRLPLTACRLPLGRGRCGAAAPHTRRCGNLARDRSRKGSGNSLVRR